MITIIIGNRLQNYALQEILKKQGHYVETITNVYGICNKKNKMKLKNKIKDKLKTILKFKAVYKRWYNFTLFNKNIKYSDFFIDKDNILINLKNMYDYFVIGSDQVWNPYFGRMSFIDFGMFAPSKKVISYAASFGISEIPKEQRNIYIKGLNHINKISVREKRGAELVKELTGKKAQIVLDPTLLLKEEDWEKVIRKPKNIPNRKFILTYLLGKSDTDIKRDIQKIANEYEFEVINLGKIEYPEYYIAGPSEFLWYIKNAEIIFTDSFHACVFSIIFNKNFYNIEKKEERNKSMNSRIDTLLSTFKLQDRVFSNCNTIELDHNYEHIKKIMEIEQEKSVNFLKNALKG